MLPNDSRNELSKSICEHLDWTTPNCHSDFRASRCCGEVRRIVSRQCGDSGQVPGRPTPDSAGEWLEYIGS